MSFAAEVLEHKQPDRCAVQQKGSLFDHFIGAGQ